ncbi:MAG: hypothetical protein AAF462_06395 [Thermodesulfobacteriota bacterium]
MNYKLIIPVFILLSALLPGLSLALPAPCTQEELLQSSDFAVEGRVTKIECEAPYESKECTAKEGAQNFVPELLAACTATVEVSENIKGPYDKGESAEIKYLQLVQKCHNGDHIIPGSPVKNFVPNSVIKYFNSEQCKYWNYSQISVPPAQDSE